MPAIGDAAPPSVGHRTLLSRCPRGRRNARRAKRGSPKTGERARRGRAGAVFPPSIDATNVRGELPGAASTREAFFRPEEKRRRRRRDPVEHELARRSGPGRAGARAWGVAVAPRQDETAVGRERLGRPFSDQSRRRAVGAAEVNGTVRPAPSPISLTSTPFRPATGPPGGPPSSQESSRSFFSPAVPTRRSDSGSRVGRGGFARRAATSCISRVPGKRRRRRLAPVGNRRQRGHTPRPPVLGRRVHDLAPSGDQARFHQSFGGRQRPTFPERSTTDQDVVPSPSARRTPPRPPWARHEVSRASSPTRRGSFQWELDAVLPPATARSTMSSFPSGLQSA